MGDQRQTAAVVGALVIRFAATFVFVLACWFGLRPERGFPLTLAFASAIRVAPGSLPYWAGGWPQ